MSHSAKAQIDAAQKKSALTEKFRSMCAERGIIAEVIFADVDQMGWYIDTTIQHRRFSFGADLRDGYTFDERLGAEYAHYTIDSGGPYFAADDKLLCLSLELIQTALADSSFRGFKPKII